MWKQPDWLALADKIERGGAVTVDEANNILTFMGWDYMPRLAPAEIAQAIREQYQGGDLL